MIQEINNDPEKEIWNILMDNAYQLGNQNGNNMLKYTSGKKIPSFSFYDCYLLLLHALKEIVGASIREVCS